MMLVIIIALAVVAVAVIAAVQSSRRRDGVASFRRQIDALSHEARRPVVDQVQNAAERRHESDPDAEDADDDDDEDGARGA